MKRTILLFPLLALSACTFLFGPELPPTDVAATAPATGAAAEATATSTEPATAAAEQTQPPQDGASDPLAGLVYRTPDGLWRIETTGEHRLLIDQPDALLLTQDSFLYADGDDLWLYDGAGGQTTNLTNTPDRVETLWTGSTHPDGAVLFASFPVDFELGPGVTGFLTIVGRDGTGYRVLDEENRVWHFALSPDGGALIYLDPSVGYVRLFDPISLVSTEVDFAKDNVLPVDWLLP